MFQYDDNLRNIQVGLKIYNTRTIVGDNGDNGYEAMLRRAEMGGGPASYIPAHTSSALAASFRT